MSYDRLIGAATILPLKGFLVNPVGIAFKSVVGGT